MRTYLGHSPFNLLGFTHSSVCERVTAHTTQSVKRFSKTSYETNGLLAIIHLIR